MNQAQVHANQIGHSVLGSLSAVVQSLASTIVTTAIKSSTLIDKTGNIAINLAGAGEVITEAAEKRAKIYARAVERNGELSEREGTLKLQLRLSALEAQEAAARLQPKPAASASKKKATAKKAAAS